MKEKFNTPAYIAFIAVYSLSCLMITKANAVFVFKYHSIPLLLLKLLIILILNYLIAMLNRNNLKRLTDYCFYYNLFVAMLFTVDYYFTNLSGNLYEQLLWLSAINFAFIGVYLALLTVKGDDFNDNSSRIIKGYTVLYFAGFVILFLRPVGNAFTLNLTLGSGSLAFIPYLHRKPYDWQVWIVIIGNLAYFIPIPFIINTFVKRLKGYHYLLIALILPLLIEGYQLVLKCGDVDVDDLLLNTSGIILGAVLLNLQKALVKHKKTAD